MNKHKVGKQSLVNIFSQTVIDGNGCFVWTGKIHKWGRMYITVSGKSLRGSRAVWLLKYGALPELCVCHTCDNGLCLNPEHLFLGTHTDNMRDKVNKNRDGGVARSNRQSTHCKQGHSFTKENTYVRRNGSRFCRQCGLNRMRRKQWLE